MNYRKYFTRELIEFGFFEDGVFTDEAFETFVSKQDLTPIEADKIEMAKMDSLRLANYAMMKENYGALMKRKPGKVRYSDGRVKDGGVEIGKVKVNEKGSYSHNYYVFNANGQQVAIINLFQQKQKGNIITGSDLYQPKARSIYDKQFKKDSKDNWPSADEKLNDLCNYLVKVGIL